MTDHRLPNAFFFVACKLKSIFSINKCSQQRNNWKFYFYLGLTERTDHQPRLKIKCYDISCDIAGINSTINNLLLAKVDNIFVAKFLMRKNFFLPLLFVLLFTACKKSDTPPSPMENTIIATVDGTKTTYTSAGCSNGLSSFSGNYVLNLTSIALYPNTIEVEVISPTVIEAKTYTNTASTNPVYIFYGPSATDDSKVSGTVTITSISATNIKGTFSGDVYGAAGEKKTISDGSFNVNF